MQQRMNQTQNQPGPADNQYTNTQATAPKKPAHEDYIDYEEIK
jgi:hypothetical protein